MWLLQVIKGSSEKTECLLELIGGEALTIGRAKSSNMRITEPSVSSNHAQITKGKDGSYKLEDLESTNGTLLNSHILSPHEQVTIRAGDVITFGEVEVKVSVAKSGAKNTPAPTPTHADSTPAMAPTPVVKAKPVPMECFKGAPRVVESPANSADDKQGTKGPSESSFPFPQSVIDGREKKIAMSKLQGSILGIYFAAQHIPAARGFTPQLLRIYQQLKTTGKPFEVIFVSSDQNVPAFKKFFGEMPWLAVPYADKNARDSLSRAFNVNGLPALVLLDENGTLITASGRVLISKQGAAGYPWKSDESKKEIGSPAKVMGDFGGLARNEFMMSKRFGGACVAPDSAEFKAEKEANDRKTVEQFMEEEFRQIIGHDGLKQQLQVFHKKVQLDVIRQKAGAQSDSKRLYHMLFMGPPGTGKTTMANVVARLLVKMGLIKNDKVVFVNNALDLLAGFVGQTSPKVDEKVAEAAGGVLFIDEAYSIVKSDKNQRDSFGQEAIDCIMKHLDPPSCVFIFAGYEKEMDQFLSTNAGLSRRVPYRYTFDKYSDSQLIQILKVMCKGREEDLDAEIEEKLPQLLARVSEEQKVSQNAGFINNLVSFAQLERDDRLDIEDALANPDLASLLCMCDFDEAFEKLSRAT